MKILVITVLLLLSGMLYAQNYDESKVGSYKLPGIFETDTTTIEDWENVRRNQILKLFEDNVYGQVPKDFDKIEWNVVNVNENAMDGRAILKEVDITVFRNKEEVTIRMVMFTPSNIEKQVPTFLVINHRGMKTMDVTRENKDGFWPAELVIEAGYGIAGFDVIDVSPDNYQTFTQGVFQLYPEQLKMNNGMAALGAWGWGASRVIDYFEQDVSVDAQKVIVVGHSRGGKASLWFGAQDQRVAMVVSNESGNSGAAISRRNFGETVERITGQFPYWFCRNYVKYANNENELPVDQHMLLSLIAPRAVYIGVADEDLWTDPHGQYLALLEAQPAFNLFGIKTNFSSTFPGLNQQIIQPHMGFHRREGKHNMTPIDWQKFIRFANSHFYRD